MNRRAVIPQTEKKSFGRILSDMRRDYWLYLMLVPGILYIAIFKYAPMYGVLISFKDYNIFRGFSGSAWVGFGIYDKLFNMGAFRQAFINNVIIGVSKLLCGFPTPIILSLMINEIRNSRGRKLIQTSVILPHFISWIVISGLLFSMFSLRSGAIPGIMRALGVTNIPDILADKEHFRLVILLSYLWKDGGYATIIYLSSIAGIDQNLYEAASIDGAGRWKQLIHVTLASLMPIIAMLFIIRVGSIMNAGFDQIFALSNPLVNSVSEVISTYVYKLGMESRKFSESTAAGLFESLIGLTFVLTTNAIAKKLDPESGIM